MYISAPRRRWDHFQVPEVKRRTTRLGRQFDRTKQSRLGAYKGHAVNSGPPVPVAQYLRMSIEHQRFSQDNQTAALQLYAEKNNFNIVKTYVDAGKSGLVLKHREGLAQLLHDVVQGCQPDYN
jgi:hypothetical protein